MREYHQIIIQKKYILTEMLMIETHENDHNWASVNRKKLFVSWIGLGDRDTASFAWYFNKQWQNVKKFQKEWKGEIDEGGEGARER